MNHKIYLQLLTSLGLSLLGAMLALLTLSGLALAQGPVIVLEKLPSSQNALANSSIAFTLTVTNTGDVELTDFSLSDPQCATLTGPNDPILSVDERQTFTCVVQNATVDFTNRATATVNSISGTVQVTDSAYVNIIAPKIDVEKSPFTQTVAAGAPVSFTIRVTNTGDIALNTLKVVDPQCSPLTGGGGTTLTLNQTRIFTCTINNISDGIINVVTATAKPQNGPNITVSDVDGAEVILTSAVQACSIDPIAYLKLDEPSGPGYDDFFSGHDGSCAPGQQCPTTLPGGKVNGAQTFNGSTSGVTVPDVPGSGSFDWAKDASFSIETWLKGVPGATCAGSGTANNEVILGRDDPNTNLHWWLGCSNTTGNARFQIADTTGDRLILEGVPINDGAWHHLVGVRDGANDVNRLYVDGVQVISGTKDYPAGFDSNSAGLNIGWLNLSGGFHFQGTLDELALYNKALSAAEIQTHYTNSSYGVSYCGGPPKIISTPPINGQVAEPYTYDVQAVGDPTPTYGLTLSPAGMTINPASGLISWTPSATQVGFIQVQVQASNSYSAVNQNFTIGVNTGIFLPLIIK